MKETIEEKRAINNMKKFARSAENMTIVSAKEMDIALELIEKLKKENEEWQTAYREAKDEQIKLIKLNQHIQKENEELKAIIAYKNGDTHRARII